MGPEWRVKSICRDFICLYRNGQLQVNPDLNEWTVEETRHGHKRCTGEEFNVNENQIICGFMGAM